MLNKDLMNKKETKRNNNNNIHDNQQRRPIANFPIRMAGDTRCTFVSRCKPNCAPFFELDLGFVYHISSLCSIWIIRGFNSTGKGFNY